MTKEEASFYLANMDRRYMEEGMSEALDMAIQALEQEPCDDAQELYEDLCEYFGDAKDILKSRKDFKAWLGRVKWHIHKAEELYEKYEQEPFDIETYCKEHFCVMVDKDIWEKAEKALKQETTTHGYMLVCPNCGLDVHSDFESCPRCGENLKARKHETRLQRERR